MGCTFWTQRHKVAFTGCVGQMSIRAISQVLFRYTTEMLQAPAHRHVSRLQPDGFKHYPASPHALSPQTCTSVLYTLDRTDSRPVAGGHVRQSFAHWLSLAVQDL